ncbi:tape measure protein [Streptococcus anginosus]|uniref:tape measure protein n=1 Tax=Streptococcus anginosus TaxID=1328 RepID=UPI001CD3B2D5|nr:tape measure protein [Streptococcus anginosus]
MADGTVVIQVDMNDNKAQSGLSRLKSALSGLGSFAPKSFGGLKTSALGMGTAFALASKVVTGALDQVKGAMSGAVSRVDTMNKFPVMMKAIGFSSQDATKAINELSKGIDGLPTALDEVVGTTQQLAMMNGDLGKSTKLTLALNNAFLASGSSSADASRGLTQFTQMMSSGKVDLQSYKTLMETMPVGLQKTAEAFGFAGASAKNDLYDALKKGTITFDQFSDKLIELNEGVNGFAELARINSVGIATSFKNIQTAVVRGVANMIQAFDKAAQANGLGSIAENLNKVKAAVSNAFNAMTPQISKFVSTTVKTFKKIFNDKSLVSLEVALHSTKTAIDSVVKALSAGINSGGWIFTAQIAVKTAISVFSNASLAVAKFVNAFAETGALANFRMMINSVLDTIQNVVKKFNDSDIAKGLGAAFGNLAKVASNAFAEIGKSINWDNVISTFSTVATTLMNIASAVIPALTKGFVAVVNVLAAIGSSSSFQLLARGIELAVQGISKLVQGIADFFAKTNGAAVDTGVIFAGLAALVAKVFGGGIRNSIGIVKGAISGLLSHIPIIGRLFKSSGNVAQQAMGKAAGATGKSVSKIAQIINSLGNILKSAGQAISTAFRGIGSSIATVLKGLGSSISSIFQSLGAGIATAAKGIGSGLSTAFQGIGKAISMMNPATVLAIAAAILAVGAAFALAGSQGEGIKTMLEGFGVLIESVGAAVSNFVSTVILSFAQALAIVIPSLAKLSPLVTAVGQAFATVITAIGGVAPQLGVLVSSIGTAIAEIISSVSELVSAFAPIVEIMANTFVRVVEVVMSAMPKIISALTPLAQIFSTTFIEITRIVSQAIVQIVQALAPFIPAISEMVTALAPVLQSLVDAFNNLISQIRPIIDSITNLFKTLGEQIRNILDGAKGVIESFGGAVRNILDGIAGIFDSIGNAALNAGKGFKELAKGVVMITDTNLADMAASLGAVAVGVGKITAQSGGMASVGTGMRSLGQGLTMVQASGTAAASVLQALASAVPAISSSITGLAPAMMQTSAAMTAFAGGAIASLVGLSVASSLVTAFNVSLTMLYSAITNVGGAIIAFGSNVTMMSTAISTVATSAYQVTTAIYQMQTAMYQTSSATLSVGQALSSLRAITAASMSGMVSAIGASMAQAQAIIRRASQEFVRAIASAVPLMKLHGLQAGQGAGQGVTTGIRSTIGQAVAAMSAMIAAVRSAGMSGVGSMNYIGAMIGQGLAAGMYSALGAVTAAANALVAQAERAAQAKAKIHSPSRLFRDNVGRYIAQGIAVGIEKNASDVTDSLAYVQQTMMKYRFNPEELLSRASGSIASQVQLNSSIDGTRKSRTQKMKDKADELVKQALEVAENAAKRPIYLMLDDGTLVGKIGGPLTEYQNDKLLLNNMMRGRLDGHNYL